MINIDGISIVDIPYSHVVAQYYGYDVTERANEIFENIVKDARILIVPVNSEWIKTDEEMIKCINDAIKQIKDKLSIDTLIACGSIYIEFLSGKKVNIRELNGNIWFSRAG